MNIQTFAGDGNRAFALLIPPQHESPVGAVHQHLEVLVESDPDDADCAGHLHVAINVRGLDSEGNIHRLAANFDREREQIDGVLPLLKYPCRMDVYGCGCAHDCKYCYAKSLLDFRGFWNPLSPSVANINKIKEQIKSIALGECGEIKAIRLGGMTDCFQPIEKIHKITYRTIKLLNEARVPYLIVTKSDLIASDEYMAILDKKLAHIQITVTTTDDALSLTYEKAVVPSRRIAAIEKLQAAGYDIALRLSPYIPEYIDLNILNSVKCDKIVVEFLRVNSWIRKWFNIDYSPFVIKQSGYWHRKLKEKKANKRDNRF